TGDCTDHRSADEYARFRDLISPLTMPVYVIPGNHDNRSALLDAFGAQGAQPLEGFAQYVVDGPVRLIALDSHIPGQGGGELCERRLAWLEARLAEAPDRPAVICLHHPPLLLDLAPLDAIGLAGSAAMAAIVARHPQVERIIAGHVHMAAQRRFA